MSTHANMVKMTVTSVASAGVGTITLNAASSGYQSFGTAYGGNATVDILITEGTAWEVARACTYTHSGTTVTRGTLEASSTGSAVAFTSAAVVSVVATANLGNRTEAALQAVTPGGRLTLESGVPVSTTDQTAKTSIYYTPFVHNIINLWDGAEWKPISFTEYTLALGTLTSGNPYDVFAYLNSGVLALEVLAWTNDTTRATAVTLQDGRYCKNGDKTRLLLGGFFTASTTTTESSVLNRYVSNVYNRVAEALTTGAITGASHTYNSGTWREWNNGTSVTRLNWFDVIPGQVPVVNFVSDTTGGGSGAQGAYTSVYIDATSGDPSESIGNITALSQRLGGSKLGATPILAAGLHYATPAESSPAAVALSFTNYWISVVIQA